MFDAKSILDALVRGGGSQQPRQHGDLAGISDMLKQLAGADQSPPAASPRQAATPGQERVSNDNQMPAERVPSQRPATTPREDDAAPGRGAQGGGLDDLLRSVLGGQGGGLGDILGKLGQQAGGSGGIADILKQVLGQATSGVKEGAGRLDDATGASRLARDAVGQATGRSPEDVLAQLKELMANNQLGTGAALGGLGTLVLGTGAGRALAGKAIKLGGLALIGGLAYKAYQNYQRGQPPLTGAGVPQQPLLAAPSGSGFEADVASNDHAALLIRAMIAAAAADGRIDAVEQKKILGGLQQAGLANAAQQFLAREVENPATIDDLANAVSSQEEAVQVYTAARVAVDPEAEEVQAFLVALAARLGIDDDLAAHIDAAARGVGT
jgi:uncharacterized membrane protein YebE (DUF533 family)